MKYNVVVVGGGPAGLGAAIEAKRNGAKDVLIIERDRELGGILNQCIHNGFGLHEFKEELTVSAEDISDITDFTFLNNNGKWVSAQELTPNEFTNGRVWSVKAKAKGYKTEEFELRIEWYQDELFITATLEPK